jgi:large subunit ribosomal protein L13
MDTISYKTLSAKKKDLKKEWFVIDAENQILGRLASKTAIIIRGKHKPNFSPHLNCGDNVIIINAEKVKLTGKKITDKVYVRHTGYPGGQRFTTPKEVLNKDPKLLVEKAVKGMLPKNKLGRDLYKSLHVFVGQEHIYNAQKPKQLNLHSIK